jgi:hypothetical protein
MRATKNAGLQPAMDHILANAEKPVPSAEELAEDDEEMNAAVAGMEEAKSIKCSECGKTFRSQATASFHAEKSGHQEFEESTEEVSGSTEGEIVSSPTRLTLSSLTFFHRAPNAHTHPDQASHRGREEGKARRAPRQACREARDAEQG